MAEVPDPTGVRSRDDFLVFMGALMTSLEATWADSISPSSGRHPSGWENWANTWAFWEAMVGWLEDVGRMEPLRDEPIGVVLLEPVEKPSIENWYDQAGLVQFLRSVAVWAENGDHLGSPDMWNRAAEALQGGATYE